MHLPIAALLLLTCVPDDFRWTGWLGADRSGQVVEGLVPASPPETLKEKWRIEVGEGYGSPLVDGERIYQHARQGEQEIVWCINRASGETIWKTSQQTPFKIGGGGEWHGKGPKSNAALGKDAIVILSIAGELTAIDTQDGAIRWKTNYASKYQPNHPYWGASTSPLIDRQRVYCHVGNDEAGTLVALDLNTGSEVWNSGSAGAAYSSPLIAEFAGQRQIVEWNHERLRGVEMETGDTLWAVPFAHEGSQQNMPTPTIHGGLILLGAENRGLHAYRPANSNGKWSVSEVWSTEKISLDMSTAVACGDRLYGLSHYGKGRLFCVDIATGQIHWQSSGRVGNNATFLATSNAVMALTDQGRFMIIKDNATQLDVAADLQVSESPTWAPPVLLPEGVLIKSREHLQLMTWD